VFRRGVSTLIGVGVQWIRFNAINDLKGSPRRRWGHFSSAFTWPGFHLLATCLFTNEFLGYGVTVRVTLRLRFGRLRGYVTVRLSLESRNP
jgi:hypothetical protein